MRKEKWNDSWKFWLDKDSFALVWDVPEIARDIVLPHDAMIEKPAYPKSLNGGNTGFRDGDIYTYVKIFYVPQDYQDKTIILKFEGIYMNALVYVNGQLAAKRPYGYSTFYVELNNYLRYGEENELRVQVRAGAMTNSRWYSGAGIYRDVYMLNAGLIYIVPEGVQIKTENADQEYAVLLIHTELKNRNHIPVELILETEIKDSAGHIVGAERTVIVFSEQEMRRVERRIVVEQPELWDEETPRLYSCMTRVYTKNGGEEILLDEDEEVFGIRTLQVDAKRGLRVNGRSVKLRGACIHHDSGLLGAATYEDAQYRQIKKLKEAGFNAVRMSHHPIAPAMLRACDELGMYVMDETFDMWNRCKSNYDYALYFQEWWEQDVTAMVRKDYNHPSVILYSVGNEIPEIGTDYGAKTCYELHEKIKSMDDTRFTLASINGVFAAGDQIGRVISDIMSDLYQTEKTNGNVNNFMTIMDQHMDRIVMHEAISERLEKACAGIDIAGYNYMTARYEPDGVRYPNRVIVGSETYPPEIARNWELVEKYAHVIGDFTWTGWDYIGEAGIGIPGYRPGEGGFGVEFPAQLAYTGDIDITGFRRPVSYYREIVFGLRTEPYIAVQNPSKYGKKIIKTPWVLSDTTSCWTWKGYEKQPVIIEVYAPGDEVELLKNGETLGRKKSGKPEGFRTLFETTYEPGILTAVVYENGLEISRTELSTAGSERKLTLQAEQGYVKDKEHQELLYIHVEIIDNKCILVQDHDVKLHILVEGNCELAGFGSGNPKPDHNFNEKITKTFHGHALIILKKIKKDGNVLVKVTAEDGTEASLQL